MQLLEPGVLALSQSTATLAAACVAAGASLAALVLNALLTRRSELRAAHRAALAEVLAELGKAAHECFAIASMVATRPLGELARRNWLARGRRANADLESLRLATRYTLWGLAEPLRTLSRVAIWIGHYPTRSGADSEELLEAANRLRRTVDAVIRSSYAKGRPPTWIERRKVQRRSDAVRKIQRRDFASDGDPAVGEPDGAEMDLQN
jgi:hypothetical protein